MTPSGGCADNPVPEPEVITTPKWTPAVPTIFVGAGAGCGVTIIIKKAGAGVKFSVFTGAD